MASKKKTTSDDDQAKIKASAIPQLELGGSGTLITHGIISGAEYDKSLAGLQGVNAYESMRNDATVNASLDVVKLPILAASWYLEPGNDDDEVYQEHADFIKQELFTNLDHTFTEFLREALNYLDYGRYAFEIVYRLRDDGQIGWKKFAARMPKTIYYWQQDDGTPGIAQILPDGRRASIPIEKLILFINRKEGDNYEGRSILRTSYRNWYTKDTLYKIQAIGLERQGVGIPYVKIPSGASPKDILKAEEFVRNMRANEESYLTWKEGWEFGFMDMKGMGQIDPSAAIAHHNREIVKNVLAQFLELGASTGSSKGGASGAAGSFALSKDQSRLFILSLQYVATYVADIITKYAIERLIDINFGPQEYYPQLKVSKIGEVDYQTLASSLQSLVTAGLITADPGLEDYLRDNMSLPDLPEEARAENEFNDFMGTLDQNTQAIDAKQQQVSASLAPEPDLISPEGDDMAQVAHERKGLVRRLFGARTASQDAKQNEPKPNPNADKITQRKSQHTVEVSQARHEFDKAKLEAQAKILKAKMSGAKMDSNDYKKLQLELLQLQSLMLDKVHNANSSAGTDIATMMGSEMPDISYVKDLKAQLDETITRLQNTFTETD
jgi:hypothetical protein